ncbi:MULTISPECIES: arsenate reductase family protein [Tenacibaculum]|nr:MULTISPECIES: ArsC/Spx/MgsR family protein [unclassified Tenacibaculum]BFF40350.1 hypothetical protein BACY1_21550 [Tenacibaculum mesophilum]GFD76101.1 hypothetical protein KUL113_55210 [Tenacibaculum sp. KUL113]GFD93851.1 hypothetical protein KUL154_25840 [Alteromonas sp. KUL154]GFE03708.1 hypothetical protein KUL156_63000 [Alteromonas sp. KUL156]MCG7503160.1 hypothetical protein [Tenacibaculum sp. Mcav3-52]
MTVLAKHKRQLLFIYSCESSFSKEMLAYASAVDKKLQIINICKEKISDTIWLEIAAMLNVTLGELFSPKHSNAENVGDVTSFDETDWLKLINSKPSLLQVPIVVNADKALRIKEKTDMMNVLDN